MKQKLVVVYRTIHYVLVVEKNGVKMKVEFCSIIQRMKNSRFLDPTSLVPKSVKGNYTCRPGANGLFADPSSCSIYHWCVLGVLHSTHYCNTGLHFSASASGCVWPKDAECEKMHREKILIDLCVLFKVKDK